MSDEQECECGQAAITVVGSTPNIEEVEYLCVACFHKWLNRNLGEPGTLSKMLERALKSGHAFHIKRVRESAKKGGANEPGGG